jgi:hypothetical protein
LMSSKVCQKRHFFSYLNGIGPRREAGWRFPQGLG